MKLCSACFLGVRCLYNCASRPNQKIINLSKTEALIPVCPEQLGGLATPREPSHIVGNKVLSRSGQDITDNFIRGAQETLKICQLFGIKEAILKQGSPSCGSGKSGPWPKQTGDGITTRLLKKHRIKVISQGQLK
ncbi:DUF523 domain-containing protein [Candidatus Shapirobacteria bacterium CG06_land_8_20_14_3_00_40_12]|uniref:DUF523 domain-containing protein n=1 Tax=Candidatus Shapirobacteria bacterium CG06_land_8_20_14_3_00_40_12 TaxID=1974881 RepID=A0A2M7AR22_9BACT|nr:MAG: DUF523 domain-containing protein [Candidatus Shapirobacteria bacterium CG06_land_8_20_14_3_00_40_12]